MGDIVSPQAQMSPYFQLREKFKCTEHIDKKETSLKLLHETRKSEQNVSQFQIASLNPVKYISIKHFSCEEFRRQGAYSLYTSVVSGLEKV